MGEAQYNRRQFLAKHPRCAYCGGNATTTDHCPPRCCFEGRRWPEGYEFPACEKCNSKGRLDELLIGILARARLHDDGDTPVQREMGRLIAGLKNNRPDVVEEMIQRNTAVQQKFGFRQIFGSAGDSMRHQGWGLATLGPLATESLNKFAIKLTQALYYYHLGKVFHGNIIARHNSLLLEHDNFFADILQFAPAMATPTRANRSLADQFRYRFNCSAEVGALIAVVEFNPQIIFSLMAVSTNAMAQMTANGLGNFSSSSAPNLISVIIPPSDTINIAE